ncbi:hypothetical protein FPV67DRAFT_1475647 [Lyophyllum atratum]|nr:hypothetical protein FPV67DRAFT_1475647 [Lyophyllum atratum]
MDPYRPSQPPSSSSFVPTTFDNDDTSDPNLMKAPKRKHPCSNWCVAYPRHRAWSYSCSSSFYASKTCTYTDASGQRLDNDQRALQPSTSTNPLPPSRDHQDDDTRKPQSNHPPQNEIPRKRFRNELGNAVPTEDISACLPLPIMDSSITGGIDRPAPVDLDHSLTRELTNLFFTHCHPARVIIHKPTFAANLAHNRVPQYLLHAVCALAAPLSKQPRLRTTPSRFAGKRFAEEALSLMFDGAGRLVCERNLATAQALCLLQVHDLKIKDKNMVWNSRYHDLALQLHEYPTLTPVPSPEFIQASIEREAYGMRLRLPVDETSFELGVHSTLPEYLYLPAVRMRYASEFGHLIRVVTIYAKVENALDELSDPDTSSNAAKALLDAEQMMDSWATSLPEHLRFSEQSLQVQQSMFETSSNTGAWAWCCMHVIHASSALALNLARQRPQRVPKSEPSWALRTLDLIMEMLGDRVKHSILMGSALWPLIKYCQRDDAQIRTWCAEYEDAWGTRIRDLVMDRYPSPPLQHQYPQNPQTTPPQSHTQPQQPQQPPQHQQQQQHRRVTEVRNPPISGARPSSHQHDSSYHRKSPSSAGSSPTSRPLEELRMHNNHNPNSSSHNRNVASQSHLNSSHSDRDNGRGHAGSGTGILGMGVGQGGNGTKREREQDGNGYPNAGQPRRSVHDADLEPARADGVNGARAGENSNINGGQAQPRGAGGNSSGDGPQSLPSLKSVGLLAVQHQVSMPVGLQWLANESR